LRSHYELSCMSNFQAIDRKTGYLLPASVDEWLPEKHLARFIGDVIDDLDLGRMSRAYRGTGSASYHPRTVLSILVYGYADEESRIMPVAGGGFEQRYNAQAAVAAGSLLVVATDVVQAPNDKCQVEPTLEKIAALPEELGEVENLLPDTGYFSADNVETCDKAGVTPVIAMGRQPHHPPLNERFAPAPEAPKEPTPVEAMAHRLKTAAGRALYALRKQTPEPCSASSSRCSDSVNFHCAGWIKFAANGVW
jgi:hypothetical protein